MKNRSISVGINNYGFYVLKTSILYGRQVTGVDADGSFRLGPWEVVDRCSTMAMGGRYFSISGTYAMFAYSVDITAGTDWPYSGIFWTNLNEPVTQLSCNMSGTCRMVDISLVVNGKTVYSRDNCDPHREWKP